MAFLAANAAIAKPAPLMCVELAALMAPIWGRRSAALVVTCGGQFVLVDPKLSGVVDRTATIAARGHAGEAAKCARKRACLGEPYRATDFRYSHAFHRQQ
jgi:hypothetical protein